MFLLKALPTPTKAENNKTEAFNLPESYHLHLEVINMIKTKASRENSGIFKYLMIFKMFLLKPVLTFSQALFLGLFSLIT